MNPQEFCAERGYDLAYLLTFNFDPLFFEKVPLRALWAGGTGEILVIADRGELATSVDRAAGHLHHLGRSYRLAAASLVGQQHAKLILRIGDEGALIWVGSGNLTYGGWGSNEELATAWKVEPTDRAGVSLVRSLVREIERMTTDDAKTLVGRASDRGWIAALATEADSSPPVVISGGGDTLAEIAAARWAGRRFDRVFVRTGSTDREGRFLRWSAETFGVREAVVALDPRHCAFAPEPLATLPCAVQLVSSGGPNHPHAKLYYFEGPDGDAAIVGSANCSAAAWLIPASRGGNVEIAVFYDQCERGDFEESLAPVLTGERKAPSEVPNLGSLVDRTPPRASDHRPTLIGLSASFSLGILRARLTNAAPPGATAEIHFGGARAPVTSDETGLVWTGSWIGPPPHPGTLFGELIIRDGDEELRSDPRWLDDEDELLHATRGRKFDDPIRRLGMASTSAEQRQTLQDLAWISQHLLEEQSAFPDPNRRTKVPNESKTTDEEAVDPELLVRSLVEVEERHFHAGQHGGGLGLPIFGVMHALFPEKHEEAHDIEAPEDETASKEPNGVSRDPHQSEGGTRTPPPPEALRKRLSNQMTRYLARSAEPEFRNTTTATQFVQAVSYPLAVAAFGVRGGWVARATAAEWVVRVCDLLFRLPTDDGSPRGGLLEAVHQRFRDSGHDELFCDVVGDGTLWVALVGALCAVPWDGPCAHLDRAVTLSDVFKERRLFARATTGRLRDLLSRLKITEDDGDVLKEARRVSGVLSALENRLKKRDAELRAAQVDRDHQQGDPLFRAQVGFARAQASTHIHEGHKLKVYIRSRAAVMNVKAAFYVNVRLAAESDAQIATFMNDLQPR